MLTGSLEKTNQCYAIAKIAGIKICEALYEDHNLDIICLMPTNVYGKNDKFDKINGHVIPAMISKFEDAKKKKLRSVKLLGTGRPLREFIHSDDLALAIYKSLRLNRLDLKKIFKNKLPILNIGTNEEISIKNLAELIKKYIDYSGKIIFDKNFPDGTYRKVLNSRKIKGLGWSPKITFKDGLKKVINDRIN